ncbi:hypothetical protein PVAP13_6NG227800 [Panicum virgatum]|uniref:Uncharacterized protein n=1 Tax=Panicum virgatum TaxID=38727 RepID=A0A8T0QYS4_PANVG|nr:hypothetical protein PVAP13_6NG227800 [Panicum virgatum]
MSVVERWVIASPKDGSSSGKELANEARSGIRSLHQIAQTISFTGLHFRDGTKLPIICEEQGKHVGVVCIPGPYHLTLVIQETMLKILTFVDIVVAWDPNTTEDFLSMDRVMLPPYNKLISLLGVCGVLFEASYKILTQISRSTCAEVRRMENEMTILLSAYEDKLGQAIRSTMEIED